MMPTVQKLDLQNQKRPEMTQTVQLLDRQKQLSSIRAASS